MRDNLQATWLRGEWAWGAAHTSKEKTTCYFINKKY